MVAIGIDLGTSFCSVGVFKNETMYIFPNDHGYRKTPSYVAFTDSERLIGNAAKNQVGMNPKNTVFDVKRLIGRKFGDQKIPEDIKRWPFSLVIYSGSPKIKVQFKGEEDNFTAEEITAMLLTKMKETAEAFLQTTVKDAVITVPANFNDSQRQATKDAGTIAGLNVLSLINEPTAAALAYGVDKNITGERNVLIFDLGGGTCDVSILTIDESLTFEVRATAGNTHLGGVDFDNRLVDYLVDEFRRKYGIHLISNQKVLQRLRIAAERAKHILSSRTEANIEIDALYEGVDFCTKISRARFEDMCGDLFRSTLDYVKKALKGAKMEKSQIDDIVLVGGSTHIPKVQHLLQRFFDGKSLNLSIKSDEVVTFGAAIQAAFLSGVKIKDSLDVRVLDVTPFSIRIKTDGGVMRKFIDRNSRIPYKKCETFTTYKDNQPTFTIQVFEGDNILLKSNYLLGTYNLICLPLAPRGELKLDVTFDLDANGILNVTGKEMTAGNVKNIRISKDKGRLYPADINYMIKCAEKFAEEDKKQRQRIAARNQLEIYIFSVKQAADEAGSRISKSDQDHLMDAYNETIQWLDANTTADKEQYDYKYEELTKICNPIFTNMIPQVPPSKCSQKSANNTEGNYDGPTVAEVD